MSVSPQFADPQALVNFPWLFDTGMIDEVYEIGGVEPWSCHWLESRDRIVEASDIVPLPGDPQPKEGFWVNDKFLEKGHS